ncbi:PSP1 domain-containing protein [Blattabacterium cuenoti]|uniref:PSP1 domain-containing protein n=1 Tax=Blattabacterium cuenoti TaxID=1653831 RepID=UPI00163CDF4D|nr:regulatory iron-sulfur-containing complex subunit RicT [Blattabacterium cuenoti]
MEKLCSNCSKINQCYNKHKKCNKLNVIDWLSHIPYPFFFNKNELVEVQFKNDRKEFFYNKKKINLNKGDFVTVESSYKIGYDIGIVTLTGRLVTLQIRNIKKPFDYLKIKNIYRKSTDKEISLCNFFKKKEHKSLIKAKKIVKKLNLTMKIFDVEYQANGDKATFYYTAENRIDFRKLIKELALTFHIRIEMRQIGYRQEAAKIGGIGSCGRELCCSTWLKNFKSVNTNSARYQQLSINIDKLTGQCNKLKCCLNYELDTYLSYIKNFPDFNSKIDTEKGIAKCMKIDVFKQQMWFSYIKSPNTWYNIEIKKIKEILKKNKTSVSLEKLSKNKIIHKTELTFKD